MFWWKYKTNTNSKPFLFITILLYIYIFYISIFNEQKLHLIVIVYKGNQIWKILILFGKQGQYFTRKKKFILKKKKIKYYSITINKEIINKNKSKRTKI